MRKIMLSLAAATALAALSVPAIAQPGRGGDYNGGGYNGGGYNGGGYGGGGYGGGGYGGQQTTGYVDGLEWKITNAAQERRISWSEARALRNELRQIQPLAWRVQTGQASGWERRRLSQGVSRIESAVNDSGRYGRHDDERRWRR